MCFVCFQQCRAVEIFFFFSETLSHVLYKVKHSNTVTLKLESECHQIMPKLKQQELQ